jgi:hypothetical protein
MEGDNYLDFVLEAGIAFDLRMGLVWISFPSTLSKACLETFTGGRFWGLPAIFHCYLLIRTVFHRFCTAFGAFPLAQTPLQSSI